jgi:uncharacterized damage-inducible protein DinB
MTSEAEGAGGAVAAGGPASALPERRFGWKKMFVAPEDDPRGQEPSQGERGTLTDYLHAYRQTLELKCAGLDAEQLARQSVPPSDLSLLGLVRHMADVERNWFRVVLAREPAPFHFGLGGDWDAAFREARADAACVEEAWRAWRDEVGFAERFVESCPDLELTGTTRHGEEVTLREVLVHMIEEYARHCGHADLLRERIDGRVGQ